MTLITEAQRLLASIKALLIANNLKEVDLQELDPEETAPVYIISLMRSVSSGMYFQIPSNPHRQTNNYPNEKEDQKALQRQCRYEVVHGLHCLRNFDRRGEEKCVGTLPQASSPQVIRTPC